MATPARSSDVLTFPTPKKAKREITCAASLHGLQAPAKGHPAIEFVDKLTKGLRLVLTAGGAQTWVFRYANAQRVMRRFVIGPFPKVSLADAREKVGELRVLLRKGEDPAETKAKRVTATTFLILITEWLAKKASTFKGRGVREAKYLASD